MVRVSLPSSSYLDRIVVLPNARRMGVGRSLYDVVFQAAKTARAERVCCEVNLEPPNPGSIRFHEQLGFQELVSNPRKKVRSGYC